MSFKKYIKRFYNLYKMAIDIERTYYQYNKYIKDKVFDIAYEREKNYIMIKMKNSYI